MAVPLHEEGHWCQAPDTRGVKPRKTGCSRLLTYLWSQPQETDYFPFFGSCVKDFFFFNPLTDEGTSIGLKSGSEENRESRYGNQAGLEMN